MGSTNRDQGDEVEYLSWLPTEKVVERSTAGSAPITLVRTQGSACDDPPSPFWGIQAIVEGQAHLECDLGRGRFRRRFLPGHFVIVPPGTPSRFAGPGTFTALSLAAPDSSFAEILESLGARDLVDREALFDRAHDDARIPALLRTMWSEVGADRRNAGLFVDGLVQAVVAAVLDLAGIESGDKGEGLDRRALDEVLDLIECSLREPLRLEQLARAAGMSTSRFSRSFKASTGTTPHQFVVHRRVENARELLGRTRLPISEIAYRVGFSDQSHLTRQFKRRVGSTPAGYRAAVGTKSSWRGGVDRLDDSSDP